MGQELFDGEGEDSLDLSTEAINERAGLSEQEPVEAAEEPVEAQEAEPEGEPPAGEPEAVEAVTEPPAEPEPEGFEMPDKFAGKSAEDIARSYAELEKLLGKREDEDMQLINELQGQVQNLSQYVQQQEQERQTRHVGTELVEQAEQGGMQATHAYNQALVAFQHGQVTSDEVDRIVATTVDVDPDIGQQMNMHWRDALMEARIEQRMAPVVQQQQQAGLSNVLESLVAEHPDINQYQDQVAQVLAQRPYLLGDKSMAAVKQGVEDALAIARAAAPAANTTTVEPASNAPAQTPAQEAAGEQTLNAMKQDAQVATGGGLDDAEAAPQSEADRVRDGLFNPARQEAAEKLWS